MNFYFKKLYPFALVPIFIYAFIAFYISYNGFPHEDAYILFIYSENFSNNGSISFYEGGPNTEGATDFLWMALISLLYKVGFVSYESSLLLNFFGLCLIAFCIVKIIGPTSKNWKISFPLILLLIFLPLSSIAYAAYGGFSTLFYSGLIFIQLYVFLELNNNRLFNLIPLIGLVITLVRPDGFFFSVPLAIVGIFLARDENRIMYLFSCILALIIGSIYFFWRFNYFGEILPLPFYVKTGQDAQMPGLIQNFYFLREYFILMLISMYIFFKNMKHKVFLVVNLSIILHFVALLFFEQSQNIGYRFNTPLFTLMIINCLYFINHIALKK